MSGRTSERPAANFPGVVSCLKTGVLAAAQYRTRTLPSCALGPASDTLDFTFRGVAVEAGQMETRGPLRGAMPMRVVRIRVMNDHRDPPNTANARPTGCERCSDPLAVTLHEPPYRRINHEVFIFRCPSCSVLILDDIVGFKGHGTVFRATEADIAAYIKAPDGRPWPIELPPEE